MEHLAGKTAGTSLAKVPRSNRQIGRRMASEHGNGMLELRARHADANCLCLRGLQLRLSRDPRPSERRCRHCIWFNVICNDLVYMRGGIIEQRLHRVRPAQLEIVAGKRGLRRQTRIGQIGLARLRTRHVALDRPPKIDPIRRDPNWHWLPD